MFRIEEHPSLPHPFDGDHLNVPSPGSSPSFASAGTLIALLQTEMANDLRNQIGPQNMRTFPGPGSGISSSRPPLIADRIIEPYVKYLKETGQLADPQTVDLLRSLVEGLGKPALAQQQGNPQQYVSHGFDHSERVADYTDKITQAYPEIEQSAASKYGISRELSRFLFQMLAHWHDTGYPDLDSRPKATHGLSSASQFDSVRDQLGTLIRREHGRPDQVIADMRKAIQLHSADVKVEDYSINVKTDRGSLLVHDVDSLRKLLDHYSTPSRHPHQVNEIEIRGRDAKEMEKQVNEILKAQALPRPVEVKAREDLPQYTGRPTSLDKDNQVKVGLRYTEQELTENPFAIIRFADNLDMAADRLSPFQRSPAFRAIYWKLGDHGPIGRALAGLSQLDGKNTTGVPEILRKLRSAAADGRSTGIDASILTDAVRQFNSGAIENMDASSARRLLTKSTVDSILRSPVARGLSTTERASLRTVGYRMNGESVRHFGGCEAIKSVDVEPGKVIVTVDKAEYERLNGLKDPDGIGIGEYQVERARQAFSSLTINGRRPAVEVVEVDAGNTASA